MFIIEISLFILTGLVFGSFASAIAHREPEGVAWWSSGVDHRRSACPSCAYLLGPLDLVPLFSWLALRGKCRKCGAGIPPSYPLIEVSCALAAAAAYLVYGLSAKSCFIMAALPFLAALLLIDIRHMLLPNKLVAILAVLGAAWLVVEGFVLQTIGPAVIVTNNLFAALLYGALAWGLGKLMSLALKKDALGMGDVKFFAVAGLWLGLSLLPDFCMLAGAFGVVLAGLWQLITKEKIFPFGPALILSFYSLLLLDGSLFG